MAADTAVASAAPVGVPMIPMGTTASAADGPFANHDACAQFMGAGVGVAGQMLAAMVK